MVNGGERKRRPYKLGSEMQEKPDIECGQTGCIHNTSESGKYGMCRCPQTVTLKWRLALDFPGKGTISYMECLNFEFKRIQ